MPRRGRAPPARGGRGRAGPGASSPAPFLMAFVGALLDAEDPALALRLALALGALARRFVAGAPEGLAGRGGEGGRRRRALAGGPFAFARGGWFGEAASHAGDVDVVQAVVGPYEARLGAEEDVVAGGVGVEEERAGRALTRGDQVDAAAGDGGVGVAGGGAGAFAGLLPLIDVPGAVGVLGDKRLVAFEEDAGAVVGDHAGGVVVGFPALDAGGGEKTFVGYSGLRTCARRIAGDAEQLPCRGVVAIDLGDGFARLGVAIVVSGGGWARGRHEGGVQAVGGHAGRAH